MMKQSILILMFCLFGFGSISAQQTEVTEEYVSDANGFVVKEGAFKVGKIQVSFAGLYTSDGKVCVKIFNRCIHQSANRLTNGVAPGTEILAPSATAGITKELLYLPRKLKKIYANALSGCLNVEFYNENDVTEQQNYLE